MRSKRNPAMPLLDQILLDKLESDLEIEKLVYATATIQEEMCAGPNATIHMHIVISNARIMAIESQIREINEQYN